MKKYKQAYIYKYTRYIQVFYGMIKRDLEML